MRLLQAFRNPPVAVALLFAVGFGAWLACDSSRSPEFTEPIGPPIGVSVSVPRDLPEDPTGTSTRQRDPSRTGIVTAEMIPRLHPGMARVDVEELIGVPPAGQVHPVSNVDGRLTYRTTYLANLEPAAKAAPGSGITVPTARSTIGIEFDASRPGHPLVKVHIPDPMS